VILAHEITEGNLIDELNLRYVDQDGDWGYEESFYKAHEKEILRECTLMYNCHLKAIRREMQVAERLGIKEKYLKFVDKVDRVIAKNKDGCVMIKEVNRERRIRGMEEL